MGRQMVYGILLWNWGDGSNKVHFIIVSVILSKKKYKINLSLFKAYSQ